MEQVEAEAAQAAASVPAGLDLTDLREPEPEPELQPPPAAGDNTLLQMSFGGAPAAVSLPDPFGLDLLGSAAPPHSPAGAMSFDLLGGGAAAAAPPVDLLGMGSVGATGPPAIAQPAVNYLSDISDGEGR